jgi:hypothetical protein
MRQICLLFICTLPLWVSAQVNFCGYDQQLQEQFQNDPEAEEHFHQQQLYISQKAIEYRAKYMANSVQAKMGGGQNCPVLNENLFIIPTIVHVLSDQSQPATDISILQIQSMIDAANVLLAANFDEIGVGFRLCLANDSQFPDGTSWTNIAEPGVMRYSSPYNFLINGPGNTFLSELIWAPHPYFHDEDYLNIVLSPYQMDQSFAAQGTAQTFPQLDTPYTGLNGGAETEYIRIPTNIFGDPAQNVNGNFYLSDYGFNNDGVVVHEIAHLFGLFHPFDPDPDICEGITMQSCDFEGDFVCDVPPVFGTTIYENQTVSGPYILGGIDIGNSCNESIDYNAFFSDFGLPIPANYVPFPFLSPNNSAFNMYDDVTNIMDYANNLQYLSPHQLTRMLTTISTLYPELSSFDNLTQRGLIQGNCVPANAIFADFDLNLIDDCAGIVDLSATPLNSALTQYNWNVNGTILNGVNVQTTIPSGQPVNITLDVSDPTCPNNFASATRVLTLDDCLQNCNLICNGTFEFGKINVFYPLTNDFDELGIISNSCGNSAQLQCWDVFGTAHVIDTKATNPEEGSFNYGWTTSSLPISPTINPNVQQPQGIEGTFAVRLSDANLVGSYVHSAIASELPATLIANQQYLLEYDWAYNASNNLPLATREIQIGFTNQHCNPNIPGFGFLGVTTDLSLSGITVNPGNWIHESVLFTANGTENSLVFSPLNDPTVVGDYFFNLFIDNVRLIPTNLDVYEVDVNASLNCGAETLNIDVNVVSVGQPQTQNLNLNLNLFGYFNEAYQLFQSIPLTINNTDFINNTATTTLTIPIPAIDNLYISANLISNSGCEFESETINVDMPWPIGQGLRITPPDCAGDSNGMIEILGGTNPWNLQQSTLNSLDLNGNIITSTTFNNSILNNVASGAYSLVITDGFCSRTFNFLVPSPLDVLSNFNISTNPSCLDNANGDLQNGTAFLNIVTLPPGYEVSDVAWLDNSGTLISNSYDVSNLPAGNYTANVSVTYNPQLNFTPLTVDDDLVYYLTSQCQYSLQFSIQTTGTTAPIIVSTPPTCQLPNSGSIAIANMNLFGNAVLFQGSSIPLPWTQLEPLEYYLVVTDQNGCVYNSMHDFSLNCPDAGFNFTINVLADACSVGSSTTLSIDVNVTGGTGNYTITYSYFGFFSGTADAAGVFNNLPLIDNTTPFIITATDANGQQSSTAWVYNGPPTVATTTTIQNPTCALSLDGSIVLNYFSSSPNSNPNFIWQDANNVVVGTAQNLVNAPAGQYTVTIIEPNIGCEYVVFSNLVAQNSLGNPIITQIPIDCGTVELVATNVSPALNFQWLFNGQPIPNQTSSVLTVEFPNFGLYTAQVSNAAGCLGSADFTVNPVVFDPAGIFTYTTTADCPGDGQEVGAATVNFTFVTPTPTTDIDWLDDAGNIVGNGLSMSNLPGGVYYLDFPNGPQCLTYSEIVVDTFDPITYNLSFTNPTCQQNCDGALNVDIDQTNVGVQLCDLQGTILAIGDINGALTYNSICGDGNAGLILKTTSGNGCTVSNTITSPNIAACCPDLEVTIQGVDMTYAYDVGYFEITFTNNGLVPVENIITTSLYNGTFFHPYAFSSSISTDTYPSMPTIPVIAPGDSESIFVYAYFSAPGWHTGGFDFSWDQVQSCNDALHIDNDWNVFVACPGHWQTGNLSCEDPTDDVDICLEFFTAFPTVEDLVVTGFNFVFRYDPGVVTFNSLTFNPSDPSLIDDSNSYYNVEELTNFPAPSLSDWVKVSGHIEFSVPVVLYSNAWGNNVQDVDIPICANFSLVDPNPFTDGDVEENYTAIAGTWSQIVTVDSDDPDIIGTQNIPTDPGLIIFDDFAGNCFDGAIPLPGFNLINPQPICSAETLMFQAETSEGIHVWNISAPIVQGESNGATWWGVNPLVFNPSDPQWQTEWPSGEYTIEHIVIVDGMAAQEIQTFNFTWNDLSLALSSSPSSCVSPDGAALAVASGGSEPYSFLWSDGSTNANAVNLIPGSYTATCTDAAGCTVQNSIGVEQLYADCCGNLTTTINVSQPICPEDFGTVAISSTGNLEPYSHVVLNVENEIVSELTALNPGLFGVETTNELGCYVVTLFTINPTPPAIVISTTVTNSSCPLSYDGSIAASATGGTAPYTYTWLLNGVEIGQGQELQNSGAELYSVLVTDAFGCSSQLEVTGGAEPYDEPDLVIVGAIGQGATHTVSDAQAWQNQLVSFGDDLIISSGVTLTLNDVAFVFAPGKTLVVEEGAWFTCNECTFNSCGNSWGGIRVLADAATSTAAGRMNLDECTISNALQGIRSVPTNWAGVYTNANIPLWKAGRIRVTNSDFINNARSITLHRSSYSNPLWQLEFVGFEGCSFTVDDNYPFNGLTVHGDLTPLESFSAHVDYTFVQGYNFRNCVFKNEMTAVDDWSDRGVAIRSYNARFWVVQNDVPTAASDWQEAHFSGFNRAIQAWVTQNPWNGMVIRNNIFDQNKIAVLTTNVCFHTIVDNRIRIGQTSGTNALNGANDFEGIVLLGGAAYQIAQNYLEEGNGLHADTRTFGIRIRDTRTDDDEVYRNEFVSLDYANLANGENIPPSGSGEGGLRYVCNSSTNNRFDFVVSDFNLDNPANIVAIARHQNAVGVNAASYQNIPSAGNTFTSNPQEQYGHFRNEGELVFYLPWNGQPNFVPVNNTNQSVSVLSFSPLLECPQTKPLIAVSGEIELDKYVERKSVLAAAEMDFYNADFLWKALIDEGDTPALKNEVTAAWPEDTWEMRDFLLAKSPGLSLAVLKEVATKTSVYPHPVALEIFLANPDVLRDTRFIQHLETKPDPMPQYMIDLLLASRDAVTFRTLLERERALSRSTMLQSARDLARMYYQYPDSIPQLDSLLQDFAPLGSHFANALAWSEAGGVPTTLLDDLDVDNTHESTAMLALSSIANGLYGDQRTWSELSTTEIQALEDVADYYTTYAGRTAMSVLNEWYDGQWFIPPGLNTTWTPRNYSNESEQLPIVQVSPNPASDVVYVMAPRGIPEDAVFSLIDATGRTVVQLQMKAGSTFAPIEVNTLHSGQYLWRCISNNGIPLGTGKLQIIR